MLKNNKYFLLELIAFICGLYLLLPLKIKPIIPIVLFVYTIFNFNFTKSKIFKLLLINSLFINFLFSLIYAYNLKFGIDYLVRCLPIPIISMFFYVLSYDDLAFFAVKFKRFFIINCVIYSVLIFTYFTYLYIETPNLDISVFYSFLDYEFFGIKEHPIYISVALGTAIFFLIQKPFEFQKKYLSSFLFILILCLMFLARKGVILAIIFAIVLYFLKTIEFKKFRFAFLGIILLFSISLLVPKAKEHYLEILNINYNTENTETSTGIRYVLWKNGLNLINNYPFFGYSIGDSNEAISNELMLNGYEKLSIQKPHCHNQYLEILLSIGFFGLLIFLFSWSILLINFLKCKDYFSFYFLIFFFIIFLTESYLYRQNGLILFSLITSLLVFKEPKYALNTLKTNKNIKIEN